MDFPTSVCPKKLILFSNLQPPFSNGPPRDARILLHFVVHSTVRAFVEENCTQSWALDSHHLLFGQFVLQNFMPSTEPGSTGLNTSPIDAVAESLTPLNKHVVSNAFASRVVYSTLVPLKLLPLL